MLEYVKTYKKTIDIYKADGRYFAKKNSYVTDLYISPQNLLMDIKEGFVIWRSISV